MKALNLGCGFNKIKAAINVDIQTPLAGLKFDLRMVFPLDSDSFDEIYLFHTIEHIEKRYHEHILKEIRRVLKASGVFYISYPEFTKCYERWYNSSADTKPFAEACLFGMQRHESDYHVCAMHTVDFTQVLVNLGFSNFAFREELGSPYNTVITMTKGNIPPSYEDILRDAVFA